MNDKLYKLIIIVFLIFILRIGSPINVQAKTYLEDNFLDGNADGWNEYSPWGSWRVENQQYIGSVILNGYPEKPSYSLIGDKTLDNYRFSLDVKSIKGIDKSILFRVDEAGRAYVVNLRSGYFGGGNDLVLAKRGKIGESSGLLLSKKNYPNTVDQWYKLEVEVNNDPENKFVNIRVKVNNEVQIEFVDKSDEDLPILKGSIGLEIWPGGYQLPPLGLETVTAYDNISLETIDKDLVLSIPDLKQGPYNPATAPWANDMYDHYLSGNNTLHAWGCAITSSAMVLQYYKHDINPGSLNTWLKNNKGFNNVYLNWPAVAMLALNNFNSSNLPLQDKPNKVMFKSLAYNAEKIDEYLTNDTPVIVKLEEPSTKATHFVVIKGKDDEGYLINDPAYVTKDHLSDYPESFYNSLRVFERSNTDLSYFVIYVDEDMSLQVFDNNGNEVLGYTSIEGPLLNQIDGTTLSEKAVKVFSYPTPSQGKYQIKLKNGKGVYKMNLYLYSTTGEVNQFDIQGLLGQKQTDTFKVIIGDTNLFENKITVQNVIDDLDAAYKNKYIYSETTYKLIRAELLLARKFETKSLTKLYKASLYTALTHIQKATPKLISVEASLILQANIKTLLNNH